MISLTIFNMTFIFIVFDFYIIEIDYLILLYIFLFLKARIYLYWQFVTTFISSFSVFMSD